MDAFSISLSLGTKNPSKQIIIITSLFVGIFHFLMPIIGYHLGNIIVSKLFITKYLTSIIFLVLALEMLLTKEQEEKPKVLNLISILIIALTVSIDSLTVGMALAIEKENIFFGACIFSLVSTLFTYLGLTLGKKISHKNKEISKYIAIIILLLVSIKYFVS